MRVRPARPGDAEALRAAVSRAGTTTVFDDCDAPLLDVSSAGVREAAACADCCFLVEDDGKPVGHALAHPDADGSEAELLSLWIHPEYAGTGVEEELLSRVACSLADDGVERIRATIDGDSPSALEFYRTIGFNLRATGTDQRVVVASVESLR